MKKILLIGALISALIPLKNYAQENLPIGWHAADIGSHDLPGSTVYDANTEVFTIQSTGDQLFGPDNLHFAYTLQTGNFEVITMVSYLSGMGQMGFYVDPYEEAGLMIREDLSPFSRAYYTSITGLQRASLRNYSRDIGDLKKLRLAATFNVYIPCWLKLRRIGNRFDSYYSLDGVNWTFCLDASIKLPMNSTCYVGLFCRGNANFVQINGWGNPNPQPIVPATAEFEVTKINEIANVYTVQNPISEQFININAGLTSLNVSSVFGHLDNDVVSYVASSSNSNTVMAMAISVTGSVEFTPKNIGSSTITLTGNVNSISLKNKFPVFVWKVPEGWQSNDLGIPKTDGFVMKEGERITIGGSANDSSSILSEGFHYMYRNLKEDTEISVKISSVQFLTPGGFGGILISANSINLNAKMARLFYSGDGIVRFESRSNQQDTLTLLAESMATLPLWIKMKKTGNLLKAYTSEDGSNWNMLGTDLNIDFVNGFMGGLIAGSSDNDKLSKCIFDDLTLNNSAHAVNNPIPDLRMTVGMTRSISISNTFGHSKEIYPTISIVNNNPAILTTSVESDSLLTIIARAVGETEITLFTGVGDNMLSNKIRVNITAALEPDWKFEDIGNISKAGFPAKLGKNTYSISTSGNMIQGTSDNFSFLYKEKSSTQQITAKVMKIEDKGSGSQAGIMFRESLLPGSLYIMYTVTAYEGIKLQYRWDDNSSSVVEISDPTITAPCWLRLSRNASNYFTASYSMDSIIWIPHGEFSVPLELPQDALVGLIATSGFNEGTSTFDHVDFSIPTGIDELGRADLFSVQQFPNPFNETTTLSIIVNEETKMEVSIYNMAGIKVAELMNEKVNPGSFILHFNAGDLNSGIYYYRVITPGKVITNKMLKIK